MGEVYRARDTKLGRDVALKILPDAFAHDAERLARFRREAHVLAALNHPGIAHIYGLEDGDGATALAMELVEGPTLADFIASGHTEAERVAARPKASASATPGGGGAPRESAIEDPSGARARSQKRGGGAPRHLEIDDALSIARQIAEALEAAHEQGI